MEELPQALFRHALKSASLRKATAESVTTLEAFKALGALEKKQLLLAWASPALDVDRAALIEDLEKAGVLPHATDAILNECYQVAVHAQFPRIFTRYVRGESANEEFVHGLLERIDASHKATLAAMKKSGELEDEKTRELVEDALARIERAAQDRQRKHVPDKDARRRGFQVYRQTCLQCHQDEGQGMVGVFPPLDGAEWVNGSADTVIRIVLKGMIGPVVVKDQPYNSAMQPHEAQLDDQQIADVVNYVRQSWGNDNPAVTPADVARLRKQHENQRGMWRAPQLLKLETRDHKASRGSRHGIINGHRFAPISRRFPTLAALWRNRSPTPTETNFFSVIK